MYKRRQSTRELLTQVNPDDQAVAAALARAEAAGRRRACALDLRALGRVVVAAAQDVGLEPESCALEDLQRAYGGEGLGLRFTGTAGGAETLRSAPPEQVRAWPFLTTRSGQTFLFGLGGRVLVRLGSGSDATCHPAHREDLFLLQLCLRQLLTLPPSGEHDPATAGAAPDAALQAAAEQVVAWMRDDCLPHVDPLA
jgi:hypothetical protein